TSFFLGETYEIQMAPGSQFSIKKDKESPGIQMADVALWLYSRGAKGRKLPIKCARVLNLVLERGWHCDFSFAGVEAGMMEKWGEVFFGPLDSEKAAEVAKMLALAEERRRASMAQYEVDGLPPFVRSLPDGPVEHQDAPSINPCLSG